MHFEEVLEDGHEQPGLEGAQRGGDGLAGPFLRVVVPEPTTLRLSYCRGVVSSETNLDCSLLPPVELVEES